MIAKTVVMMSLLLASAEALAGGVYRCDTPQGVRFQEIPCPQDGKKIVGAPSKAPAVTEHGTLLADSKIPIVYVRWIEWWFPRGVLAKLTSNGNNEIWISADWNKVPRLKGFDPKKTAAAQFLELVPDVQAVKIVAFSPQGDRLGELSMSRQEFNAQKEAERDPCERVAGNKSELRKLIAAGGKCHSCNYLTINKLAIGLSKADFRQLCGSPERTNRTMTSNHEREQWIYDRNYYYFTDGILTSWQD